jgi:hypothetical protein
MDTNYINTEEKITTTLNKKKKKIHTHTHTHTQRESLVILDLDKIDHVKLGQTQSGRFTKKLAEQRMTRL